MADALLAAIGAEVRYPQCPLCYRHDGSHVLGCRVADYLQQLPQAGVRQLQARIRTLATTMEEIDAYMGCPAAPALKVRRARTLARAALGRL